MSNPPRTKDFSASINLLPGTTTNIIIVGEVETGASTKLPVLKRADPQGIVGAHLLLDLSVQDNGGTGTQAFQFRSVCHEEEASQGQYSKVEIRWMNEILLSLEVTETH